MMESFDVSLFEVGFQKIVDTLAQYGVDISWGEKQRYKALDAWRDWERLTDAQFAEIAHTLLADIEPQLRQSLKATLDTAIPREVSEVEITIETNLGESRRYTFASISEAVDFLESFDEDVMLNDTSGPVLWDSQGEPQNGLEQAEE
jgi:hypothetical protein